MRLHLTRSQKNKTEVQDLFLPPRPNEKEKRGYHTERSSFFLGQSYAFFTYIAQPLFYRHPEYYTVLQIDVGGRRKFI